MSNNESKRIAGGKEGRSDLSHRVSSQSREAMIIDWKTEPIHRIVITQQSSGLMACRRDMGFCQPKCVEHVRI